jgi:hypothetical protein
MWFDPTRTALAGASQAQLQAWLATAQASYVELCSGQQMVTSVGYDGKNVTYLATDIQRLEAFIFLLQRMLGINRGRRALRPYFAR